MMTKFIIPFGNQTIEVTVDENDDGDNKVVGDSNSVEMLDFMLSEGVTLGGKGFKGLHKASAPSINAVLLRDNVPFEYEGEDPAGVTLPGAKT